MECNFFKTIVTTWFNEYIYNCIKFIAVTN